MLSDEQIEIYFSEMEKELRNDGHKREVKLSADWIREFPNEAGVYVAWEKGEERMVYIGESGNVKGRMKDLLDSRHHTLRRNIGKENFSTKPGFKDANSKKKFPKHIEEMVDVWLKERITISVLPIKLGRKEFEERMYKKYKPKYNKKGQRR